MKRDHQQSRSGSGQTGTTSGAVAPSASGRESVGINELHRIVVVLPFKGEQRQVSCSWGLGVALVLVMIALAAGGLWAVVDYARLAALSQNYTSTIASLTEQKSSLERSAADLQAQVARISFRARALLKRGQFGVSPTISTAAPESAPQTKPEDEWTSFGDVGPWWMMGRENRERGGVGGAESECAPSQDGCKRSATASSTPQRIRTISIARRGLSSSVASPHALVSQNLPLPSVPLMVPIAGRVTSHYGVRTSPFSGGRRMHEGMDIDCARGAPIQSSAVGIVNAVGRHSTYGLVVDIAHGGDIVTRYAHLSAAAVRVGMRVGRGTTIGRCGSSGRSTGSHLHFEVQVRGRPVDPRNYLFHGKDKGAPAQRPQVQMAARAKGNRRVG